MTSSSDRVPDGWGRLADGAITAIVLGAPLAVATVHPAPWIAVWLLSGAALFAARLSGDKSASPPRVLTALITLAGVAVGVSLVPLPPSLLDWLSPEASATWALGPVGGASGGAWNPIHQAPGAGLFQLLRWGAVATFVLACAARRRSFGVLRTSITVVAAGLLTIAVTGVQTALQIDAILGLYEPTWGFATALRATFVNPNHFGAYLGLVTVLSIGLLIRQDAPTPARILGLVTAGSAVLALAGTGSRGGALGTAVGVAALAALSVRPRRGWTRGSVVLAGAGVATLLAVAVLWVQHLSPRFVAPDTGLERSLSETEDRLQNLPQMLELLDAHRWTGVGRGAFVDTFPRFRESGGRVIFTQIEVLPLQLLVDHGVVLGMTLFLLLGLALALCLRAAVRHPSRAPAAAALLGLGVHELFDFSLETGAVLLTAALLALLCLDRRTPWSAPRWAAALACVAAAAVVSVPQVGHWTQSADHEARIGARRLPPDELQQASEELWSRHPSSWFLALQLARGWAAAGDLSMALQWTNRAMLLAPRQPDPHLVAARLLRQFGHPRQALGEYRLALGADLRVTGQVVIAEVSRDYEDPDALLRLKSPDRPGLDPWIALFGLVQGDVRARQLAHDAWRELPDNQLAFVVEAWARVQEGQSDSALTMLLEHQDRPDLTEYVQLQMAWVAHKAGDIELAVEYLEPVLDGPEGPRRGLWLLAGTWLVELGRDGDARRALRRARASDMRVSATPQTISESLRLEARLAQQDGALREAFELLRRAELAAPGRLETCLDEVRLLREMGRPDDSLVRLQSVAYIHGDEPRFRALALQMGWTPPSFPEGSLPDEPRGGR